MNAKTLGASLVSWMRSRAGGLSGVVMALVVILGVFYVPPAAKVQPGKASSGDYLLPPGEVQLSTRVLQRDLGMNPKLASQVARSVVRYSRASNIPWQLVVAVIKVESAGSPRAVSSSGAKGLMQVMPFWSKELGAGHRSILEPQTNVWLGIFILKHYLNRYKELDAALAAYNGSLGSSRYPKKVFAAYRELVNNQFN